MNEISLIRGDTKHLWIDKIVYDGTEREYEMQDTDRIYFEVKEKPYSAEAKIHKEIAKADLVDGKIPIDILPSDTAGLNVRQYVYDVRLMCGEKDIYTIIPCAVFEVKENVTDMPTEGAG